MDTFIYVRKNGILHNEYESMESLRKIARAYQWNIVSEQVEKQYHPLYLDSGVCPLFEIMKITNCDLLLIQGADQLSIVPEQIMKFNEMLMDHQMRTYLGIDQQYLNEWVYDFKLLTS